MPVQFPANTTDCGIFMIEYARHLAKKGDFKFKFSQQDMSRLRKKIAFEMLTGELVEYPEDTATK